MIGEVLRKVIVVLTIAIGLFGGKAAMAQEYHFAAEYGIFTDKYEDLTRIETYVDSFEYKIDIPLREGMVLKFTTGVEWEDIDKSTKKSIQAVIHRPYDHSLRLIQIEKIKFSGSKRLKSLLFKGVFRSGSKLIRVDMYIPLPKK